MKNYKSLLPIVFLSIFAINVNAEVLIPSDEDKESLMVYLVKNPQVDSSIFTKDIDNNLTFEKNSYRLNDGIISSNACLLIDLSQINTWGYLGQIFNENDANLYLVESIYTQYGISNLAKILSEQSEQTFIDFASSKGLELKVETFCKNIKNGNSSALNSRPDIFLIPNYLYNLLKGYEQSSALPSSDELMTSLTGDDVLISWTFDEILALSNNYLEGLAEGEKGEKEFMEGFTNLAEQKSKDFVGSLFIKLNDYGNPKFCTLNYSDDDAVAVIGYRQMGDAMAHSALSDYYNEKEITLNHNENDYYFDNTFDDIGEAFDNIKPKLANNEDYCNIFIDYPENLLKLKNALERDLGVQTVIGNLLDRTTTSNQYALGQGYDNYEQLNFAYQIEANYGEIKSLENNQILNQSEFKKVQDEIVSTGYSNDTSTNNVLTYLDDLSNAQQQNMNVNEYRDARVEEEERLAKIAREEEQLRQAKLAKEEQLRQAEFAKEYPYTATLTCGMGGGDHINIFGCFAGSGSYGADTELEITNGQNYQMYKVYNLGQAGKEYRTGLEINLKESFKIFAQNSAEYLVLSLKIVDNATGTTLYQDSAAQYGVINVSN